MSLFKQAQAIDVSSRAQGARQPVSTTQVDPARFAELATLVEEALPNAELNTAAIEKNGLSPTGEKMVPFAVKQRWPTKCSVTFYYNGRVVWAGLDPIALPAS
jgi:hypothetical protein